jgi:hypothetical protein
VIPVEGVKMTIKELKRYPYGSKEIKNYVYACKIEM